MTEATQQISKINQVSELEFTGNWFIDAGILGFANLMEKVYGWNLEDLQKRISKEPEKIYYGYFPIAFVYYNLLEQNKFNNLKDPKKANIVFSTPQKIEFFEAAWEFIENNYLQKEKGRIPLSSSHEFYYFHNFLFFQPRWNKDKQKAAFKQLLGLEEKVNEEVLLYIDKTINKFLPSKEEFSNIPYTESLITLSTLKKISIYAPIFILTFPIGFLSLENEKDKTLFYSPNLEFSYKVNKRIQLTKEKVKKGGSILKLTWNAIIATLTELKSQWTLENMYLISYKIGRNQQLFDVKYIGIPKLQASILIDDTIRYNLNNKIQFRSKNFDNNKCWLLEEFIKGRSLYPTILNHVNLVVNEETHLRWSPSLYSLITGAKILEFRRKNKGKSLFSNDFFDTYKSLTNEIKKDVRYTSFSTSLISQISKDTDKKRRIARELFGALKEGNKNIFLNILLKYMNEEKGICSNKNLNGWIFERIIKNDINYKMYGLVLIMNLLKGG